MGRVIHHDPPRHLTKIQAALIAGCHPNTIDRRIRAGLLKAQRTFGRWVIELADLDTFIEEEADRSRRENAKSYPA